MTVLPTAASASIRALSLLVIAIGLVSVVSVQAESPFGGADQARLGLMQRLADLPASQTRDETGAVTAVFGIPLMEATRVLAPVSQAWSLPLDWSPPDLVPVSGVMGQPARRILKPDLDAMLGDAHREGAPLNVLSAYRSTSQQALLFELGIARQHARAESPISHEEAELRAMRFNARPGHSQHQLGTAIDFTSPEIGYGIGARFATTNAGEWLAEHSWRYGFVFPYTRDGEFRSGYAYEPWHVRWVGRELATMMQGERYTLARAPIADDYVWAALQLAVPHGAPPLE